MGAFYTHFQEIEVFDHDEMFKIKELCNHTYSMEIIKNKICLTCGWEKPLYDFGENKCSEDGKSDICKWCRNAKNKLYIDEFCKQCLNCKIIKDKKLFNTGNNTCKKCINEQSQNQIKKQVKENKEDRKKLKSCIKCNKLKSLVAFYINRENKDNRSDICKACTYEATEKKCSRCGIIKQLKEFDKNIRQKYGVTPHCTKCEKKDRLKRKFDDKEKELLRAAKGRARNKLLDFDLELTDIIIPKKCPVLGTPLKLNFGKVGHTSPTIDRIDSSKGYTKDNICIISHRANTLKSNGTLEELEAVLNYMIRTLKCNLHNNLFTDIKIQTFNIKYLKESLHDAKRRAKKKNLEFNININDLVIYEKCPALNVSLQRGKGQATYNSPSLDRINTKLGYVKGNICYISHRANSLKRDATIKEIKQIIKYMKK